MKEGVQTHLIAPCHGAVNCFLNAPPPTLVSLNIVVSGGSLNFFMDRQRQVGDDRVVVKCGEVNIGGPYHMFRAHE